MVQKNLAVGTKKFPQWNSFGGWLRIVHVQKNKKANNMYEGALFRLQQYMSRTCFEPILSAIKYTKENPPAFVDHFWEVRVLIDAWSESMSNFFRQVGSTRLTNQFPNGSMNSPARKLIAQQLIENQCLDKEVRETNWHK